MDPHGQEFLFFAAGVMFFTLPLIYAWLVIRGLMGRTSVPVGAAAGCLVIWLIQIPIMVVLGLGCVGGGCAAYVVRDLALIAVFDVAPFSWLVWKFRP